MPRIGNSNKNFVESPWFQTQGFTCSHLPLFLVSFACVCAQPELIKVSGLCPVPSARSLTREEQQLPLRPQRAQGIPAQKCI